MKTINFSQYANQWFVATVSALTFVYVLTLFLQIMTYDKPVHRVANRDFVREVTRWPGHTKGVNIPVEYEQIKINVQDN